MTMNYITIGALVVAFLFLLGLLLGSFFTIDQQHLGLVERFGKYNRTTSPGLSFKLPFIESVIEVTLEVQEEKFSVKTKTSDNVFTTFHLAVQTLVRPDRVVDAQYLLADPWAQIESYTSSAVITEASRMTLDHVFEHRQEMADEVKKALTLVIDQYGYTVVQCLVTSIEPDPGVAAAMNDINAAKRLRIASADRAEAERIMMVAKAQAEAESKKLQGEGVAAQREAIAAGIAESHRLIQESGMDPDEATRVLLMTQYFDMLSSIGKTSNTIMVPSDPGGMASIGNQIKLAVAAINQPENTYDASTPS